MGFEVPPDIFGVKLGIAALIATASGLIRGFAGFGSALVNAPPVLTVIRAAGRSTHVCRL
jgi:uncharacterized membrane protein YfcA